SLVDGVRVPDRLFERAATVMVLSGGTSLDVVLDPFQGTVLAGELLGNERAAIAVMVGQVLAHVAERGGEVRVNKEDGRLSEAKQAYEKGLILLRLLAAKFQDNAEYRSELARCLDNLGLLLLKDEEPAGACVLFEEAVIHQKAALELDPQHPTYRRYLHHH